MTIEEIAGCVRDEHTQYLRSRFAAHNRPVLVLGNWGIINSELAVIISSLQARGHWSRIEHLDLSNTSVDDRIVTDVFLPKNLSVLEVQLTHVTPGRVQELRRLRPGLRILS